MKAVGKAAGIQRPMTGQRKEVRKLVSVLILNQSVPLTRLTEGSGGVTRCLKSQAGDKALAMRASPQLRLPGSKIQTLPQGTHSNTAGSIALMALHAAQVYVWDKVTSLSPCMLPVRTGLRKIWGSKTGGGF